MLLNELTLVEDPHPHSAALNMAIDEVLLEGAKGPLLRYYRWERPAVSFGYFANWAEVLREWPGRDAVRRWTGGGVVPHGEDFTYSLVVPRGHALAESAAPECYRRVHGAVARAYAASARLAEVAGVRVSSACFENPAESNVVVEGVKRAGAAQRRTARGLLHQGSVQGEDPGFRERLGRELAEEVIRRRVTREELAAARELAGRKYATDAWLRRF